MSGLKQFMAATALGLTISSSASADNVDDAILEYAKSECTSLTEQIDTMENVRRVLTLRSPFIKQLPESLQEQELNALLQEFSRMTQVIDNLGDQRLAIENQLNELGIYERTACDPLTHLAEGETFGTKALAEDWAFIKQLREEILPEREQKISDTEKKIRARLAEGPKP